MTTTTPVYAWPIPEPTDLISQGFDAIDDLAVAVEATLGALAGDSGWQAIPFLGTWANYGGGYPPAGARKIGKRVFLRGLVANGAINSAIGTLPVGFRPPYTHLVPIMVAGHTVAGSGSINGGSFVAGANITNTSNPVAGSGVANHVHPHAHQHDAGGLGVSVNSALGQIAQRLDIATSGVLTPNGTSTSSYLSLDGISFFID